MTFSSNLNISALELPLSFRGLKECQQEQFIPCDVVCNTVERTEKVLGS